MAETKKEGNGLKGFWNRNKDTIKNVTIGVLMPLAVIGLVSLNEKDRIIDVEIESNEDEPVMYLEDVKEEA